MTLVIAEAGVNHNGNVEIGIELIEKAALAGADIVKFQTFSVENLVTKKTKMSAYQIKNVKDVNSQFDLLKNLELSKQDFLKLAKHAHQHNIQFLSTAFDERSLRFLVSEVGIKKLKISSGDLTNAPLLLSHAQTNLDIMLSTGMAKLADVEAALGVLAFGYLYPDAPATNLVDFDNAYRSSLGQKKLREKVTLLHCTTDYPAALSTINLKNINTLSQTFQLKTGYSDHSEGINVSIAAAAVGATVVEKHFTLDRTMVGPDHEASIDPDALSALVKGVREVNLALGTSIKFLQATELKHLDKARKTVVATQDIAVGEIFSVDNISTKRGPFIHSPYEIYSLYNKVATKSYKNDDAINE